MLKTVVLTKIGLETMIFFAYLMNIKNKKNRIYLK